MAMELEKQKQYLQKLIEEYQQKLKEIQFIKDDYERLKLQQEGITQLHASYEFPYPLPNEHEPKETHMLMVKHELTTKMVKELIERNVITFRLENQNDFDYFMGKGRLHAILTYLKY